MLFLFVIVYNLTFLGHPSKWTSRGTGRCPSGCGYTYSNAWKPKICPKCGFDNRGRHEPKGKKLKLDRLAKLCSYSSIIATEVIFCPDQFQTQQSVCNTIQLRFCRSF